MAQPDLQGVVASLRTLTDQASLIANLPTNGVALANRVNALEQRSNALDRNHAIILQQMQTNHDAMIARIDTLEQNIGARIDNVQQDLGALYVQVYLIGSFTNFVQGRLPSGEAVQLCY